MIIFEYRVLRPEFIPLGLKRESMLPSIASRETLARVSLASSTRKVMWTPIVSAG